MTTAEQERAARWLSVQEAARELGVTSEIVLSWVLSGDLTALDTSATGRRRIYKFRCDWIDQFKAKPRPISAFVKGSEGSGVYVIWAEGTNRYKIGFSEDVKQRLLELECSSAFPLKLVAFIPQATLAAESALHERFAASRLHREWFEESPELLAFIEEHKP